MIEDRYSPPPDMSAFDPDKSADGNTPSENAAYRTGVDALMESEKITEEIRNYEHDVWNF
jgi:hypothetical protein